MHIQQVDLLLFYFGGILFDYILRMVIADYLFFCYIST